MQASGDVAAVANNVNDESVGNHSLDQRKIEQVQRRGFSPTADTLLAGDGFHHDAQEVAGIAAIFHDTLIDIFGIKSGALKQLAGEILVEQLAAVAGGGEVAEAQAEQVKGVALGMIDGEAARRKQRVIQELGSGSSTAQHKRSEERRVGKECRSRWASY